MSGRATISLVAAFLIAAGAYWFIESRASSKARRDWEAKRLFQFEPEEVNHITIERIDEPPVAAVRDQGGPWRIVEPATGIPANQIVWGRVALHAARLTGEREVASSEANLEAFQLDAPVLKVILGTTTNELVQISYGSNDPTLQYRYTRIGTGPVVLTPVESYLEVNRPLDQLRDSLLFPTGESGPKRIEFSRIYTGDSTQIEEGQRVPQIGEESIKVVLVRDEHGAWQMLSPVRDKAHQERVSELAKEVQFMRGNLYIDRPERLSDYGLDPPQAKITVAGDGQPSTLLLGSASGSTGGSGIYAKLEAFPSVFTIDAYLLSLLQGPPDTFRETRLFGGIAKNLATIQYRDATHAIVLTNDPESGWKMTQPAVDDTDPIAVSEFISFLKSTGAAAFTEGAPGAAFDDPRIVIDFTYLDGSPPTSILVGQPVPDSQPPLLFARQDNGAEILISGEVALGLQKRPFDFRKKMILPFDRAEATALSVTFEGTDYRMRKADGRWVLITPEDYRLTAASDVDAILLKLSRLAATGVAEPAPIAEVQGVDTPVLSATVTIEDESAPARDLGPLRIGNLKANASRERFAVVAGRTEVFYVEQSIIDDVRRALMGMVPKN